MLQPHIYEDGRPHTYTDYHPRWLRYHVSTYWWLQRWSYFAFILREASCVFVAWFVVYLLMLVRAVNQGDAAYQDVLTWSASRPILLLNLVSFASSSFTRSRFSARHRRRWWCTLAARASRTAW